MQTCMLDCAGLCLCVSAAALHVFLSACLPCDVDHSGSRCIFHIDISLW